MTDRERLLEEKGYCQACEIITTGKIIITMKSGRVVVLPYCSKHIDTQLGAMNFGSVAEWSYIKDGKFNEIRGTDKRGGE